MHRRGFLVWGLALAALGCAEQEVYWTRQGAEESQFRRTSRGCNENAQIQVFQEGRSSNRPPPKDAFEAESEKNRQERRRRFLYGECMESKGWLRNYEGQGYKSPPTRLPESQ